MGGNLFVVAVYFLCKPLYGITFLNVINVLYTIFATEW